MVKNYLVQSGWFKIKGRGNMCDLGYKDDRGGKECKDGNNV
jgi:hypothetical protein